MHKIIKIENGLIDGTVRMDSGSRKTRKEPITYTGRRMSSGNSWNWQDTLLFWAMTVKILNIYRTKDVVEKSFDNIKNELDLEKLRIHSDKAMEGRILIGFIALIITSYIRKIMEDKNLYSSYSLNKLYSELKKLRLIEFKNGKQVLTELTNHKTIFKAFNLKAPAPSSL